ncbi:MAG: nucleotidyltransferase domain-containing protein [Coriobacteriia bacterium]
MLNRLLGSKTRARLLTLFMTHAHRRFYLREAAREAGVPLRGAQLELANLTALGILRRQPEGSNVWFAVAEDHPIYPELRLLVLKTTGIGAVISDELRSHDATGIEAALIFGSVAEGTDDADSDVDLMVVTDGATDPVYEAVEAAEEIVKRPVNVVVFTRSELEQRLTSADGFTRRALEGAKIFLIGGTDGIPGSPSSGADTTGPR